MNCITLTSILGNKDALWYTSLLLKKARLPVKHLNTPLQYETRFSAFAYTYLAVIHLNIRKLDLSLLLRDCTTVIIWRSGGRMERKEHLHLQNCVVENDKKEKKINQFCIKWPNLALMFFVFFFF